MVNWIAFLKKQTLFILIYYGNTIFKLQSSIFRCLEFTSSPPPTPLPHLPRPSPRQVICICTFNPFLTYLYWFFFCSWLNLTRNTILTCAHPFRWYPCHISIFFLSQYFVEWCTGVESFVVLVEWLEHSITSWRSIRLVSDFVDDTQYSIQYYSIFTLLLLAT